MPGKVRISSLQLAFLIIGLLFSDYSIINPARFAMADAWLAFIIGMTLGLLLVTLYIAIAKFHPGKTFIEILRATFGNLLGTLFSLLYIWYFIHIASLVLRTFTEYMGNMIYVQPPQSIVAIAITLTVVYITRKGFEVMGRVAEAFVPFLIITSLALTIMVVKESNFSYLLPFCKDGIKPVLRTGWGIASFPFGELIVLLMVFPYLNEKNHLAKATYMGVGIGGLILLSITLRDLLSIGPHVLSMVVFPPIFSASLLPALILEPLTSANMLIGGSCILDVYVHCTSLAIAQVFDLDNPRAFIIPICTIVVGMSIWLYDSLPEMFRIAQEVFPYYSLPFQVFIPLGVLGISFVKNKRQKPQ